MFVGTFPLEAAEEVCGALLDDLGALVDSSLVKRIGDDRFLMLDTIREYARERLEGVVGGDGAPRKARGVLLRPRRAGLYASLRRRSRAGSRGSSTITTTSARPSTGCSRTTPTPHSASLARSAGSGSRGLVREGTGRLAVLAPLAALAASDTTGAIRARAHTAYGALVARLHDAAAGIAELDEAVGSWRDLGDLDELASALDSLGWPLVYDAGDDARALEVFEESLALRRELGDEAGATRALVGISQVLVAMGDTDPTGSKAWFKKNA